MTSLLVFRQRFGYPSLYLIHLDMTVGFAIATIFFSYTKIIEFRIRTIQLTVSKEQPFDMAVEDMSLFIKILLLVLPLTLLHDSMANIFNDNGQNIFLPLLCFLQGFVKFLSFFPSQISKLL